MNVAELIEKLTMYSVASPENGLAEVRILFPDGISYDIDRGEDARGMRNEHYLLLLPSGVGGVGIKSVVRR